jgi:sulfur-oxidizing protein SoxZ
VSQAVSRNPVFSFRLKGAKAGDKVEISWLDSHGERSQASAAFA